MTNSLLHGPLSRALIDEVNRLFIPFSSSLSRAIIDEVNRLFIEAGLGKPIRVTLVARTTLNSEGGDKDVLVEVSLHYSLSLSSDSMLSLSSNSICFPCAIHSFPSFLLPHFLSHLFFSLTFSHTFSSLTPFLLPHFLPHFLSHIFLQVSPEVAPSVLQSISGHLSSTSSGQTRGVLSLPALLSLTRIGAGPPPSGRPSTNLQNSASSTIR